MKKTKTKNVTERCGQTCEVYSRIVGYHRPINQWNLGKQEEYKNRKNYKISNLTSKADKDKRIHNSQTK